MDTKKIDEKIHYVLTAHLKKRGLRFAITDTESLISRGVIDSLGAIELVSELEDKFGIKILPEEMTEVNFDSIAKIRYFIQGKLRK